MQILIEQVQVLRSDVTEAQMSDCLIAAGKQIFVVRKRPLFDARASFEGDDVAGIGGKRLAIVGLVAYRYKLVYEQLRTILARLAVRNYAFDASREEHRAMPA